MSAASPAGRFPSEEPGDWLPRPSRAAFVPFHQQEYGGGVGTPIGVPQKEERVIPFPSSGSAGVGQPLAPVTSEEDSSAYLLTELQASLLREKAVEDIVNDRLETIVKEVGNKLAIALLSEDPQDRSKVEVRMTEWHTSEGDDVNKIYLIPGGDTLTYHPEKLAGVALEGVILRDFFQDLVSDHLEINGLEINEENLKKAVRYVINLLFQDDEKQDLDEESLVGLEQQVNSSDVQLTHALLIRTMLSYFHNTLNEQADMFQITRPEHVIPEMPWDNRQEAVLALLRNQSTINPVYEAIKTVNPQLRLYSEDEQDSISVSTVEFVVSYIKVWHFHSLLNVSGTESESPIPSKYFQKLAQNALDQITQGITIGQEARFNASHVLSMTGNVNKSDDPIMSATRVYLLKKKLDKNEN